MMLFTIAFFHFIFHRFRCMYHGQLFWATTFGLLGRNGCTRSWHFRLLGLALFHYVYPYREG